MIDIESAGLLGDPEIEYRPYPRWVLSLVDSLIKVGRGRGGETVRTENDWKLVEDIFSFWVKQYPKESKEFFDTVPQIRNTRTRADGLSDSKEIKYVGTLPPRLMHFIKIFFPYQQYDKDFVYKLVKRFAILKVGGY